MKFRILGILAGLILTVFSGQSLAQSLSGQILDRDTRLGIDMATVVINPTTGTLTDSLGYFSFEVSKYPIELTISHLSYGTQSFTLNYHPKEDLVFLLEQVRTYIPEILVSGKKLQILTKGSDYSVSSFEFDDKFMWQIGMVNNRPRKTRLYQTNLIGDTINSIPIKLPASLLKDYFGNIHLETKDSVYQIFGTKDNIQLLYGDKREELRKILGSYQATLGEGLVFFSSYSNIGEIHVYYIDNTMYKHEPLMIIEDMPDDHSWLPDGLKQMGRYMGTRTVQQILNQQRDYYKVFCKDTIFKIKDSLYILDLNNDKLHSIGPDKKLIRSVPISFTHHPKPTITNLFFNFYGIITDPLNHRVYVQYHTNNKWSFIPLNPLTGETGQEIPIPIYNAMANIRVHGGAIYFTYPEKIFPYFQRIYRQVIE